MRHMLLCAGLSLGLSSCVAQPPEGLRLTPEGDGPRIVVDWDAEPLPELPFPNDLATRSDPMSPTGLRVNISELADTESEAEARRKFNELTGFGIYAPITVAFDARIDLDDVLDRHPNDVHIRGAFYDDAFLVIDVTPDSPTYLQPVELDVGHGRFPMDVPRPDRYFPNDSRSHSPSLIFDTVDEDLDGDGELDWGEDLDNDGVLDKPNVWPEGGDSRDDLLTWYELETNTLILRPVVPLREETTYAVVLTDRLTDVDGNPVRSPWETVNHTRQTQALAPLERALPELKLTVDDVAFAWTFTTGRVTGDLIDIHRGLVDGEGPYPFLADDYPAGITQALTLHERDDIDLYRLPMADVIRTLVDLEVFEGEEGEFLEQAYTSFSSDIVGGAFETPYLLADRDDGGRDDSDEWWQLDPVRGTLHAAPQRIAFTCLLPQREAGDPPADVALFGHGYGSSRFDLFGFAHAFNRVGLAACAFDFPGHGPTLGDDLQDVVDAVLSAKQLSSFLSHLNDSRQRDLNNDGDPDSGGDQWSADPFHTRDMVRQAAVDWMQMVRGLKQCGAGEMNLTASTPEGPIQTNDTRVSCDWDDDGVPDLGGPNAKYYVAGGSLGGINASVAAGVMPEITAWAPIVPGGGTLDIGVRTEIGGAVEALIGRLVTPMFLGFPTDDGGLELRQMVNSVTDMEQLHVATLPAIPAGGRIEVENLDSGIVREGFIPADGRLRLSIPADALDPFEKRVTTGMPDSGPQAGVTYEVDDNAGLGDRFVVRIYDADGAEVATIDRFEQDVVHEGVTMRAGSPLIAGSHGTGHIRGTPGVRRLASILAAALEPGDAISYAPLWIERPPEELDAEPINVALVPTPGDMIVSINTGIAMGRASGLLDWRTVDDRYGMTADQWLIDRRVVQGIAYAGPYRDDQGRPILFDADDLDDGTDGTGAPSDAPLRATVTTSSGTSGMRLPYVKTTGSHGFTLPEPSRPFDIATFSIHQLAWYFATDGQELLDDPCFEDVSCDFLPQVEAP